MRLALGEEILSQSTVELDFFEPTRTSDSKVLKEDGDKFNAHFKVHTNLKDAENATTVAMETRTKLGEFARNELRSKDYNIRYSFFVKLFNFSFVCVDYDV